MTSSTPYTIKWGILATGGIAQCESSLLLVLLPKDNNAHSFEPQASARTYSPTLPLEKSTTFAMRLSPSPPPPQPTGLATSSRISTVPPQPLSTARTLS